VVDVFCKLVQLGLLLFDVAGLLSLFPRGERGVFVVGSVVVSLLSIAVEIFKLETVP
jgi:hypothetical protein